MDNILHFGDQKVRHVMIDGEPWFHAADSCKCVGLPVDKGTYPHLRRVGGDEKRIAPTGNRGKGSRTATYLSESGLYKLVMRSDKPDALKFQDWVTREVLPAIRKTGGYLLNEDMRETAAADDREEFPLPVSFSDALRKLADEVERRLPRVIPAPIVVGTVAPSFTPRVPLLATVALDRCEGILN